MNGVYPKKLRDAWEQFDKEKGSDNDRPWDILKKSQLYLVMKMENCGVELDGEKLKAKEAIGLVETYKISFFSKLFSQKFIDLGNTFDELKTRLYRYSQNSCREFGRS